MVPDELISSIGDGQTLLFAGAGLSMSLKLPSWAQLIEHLASELGYDPDVFAGLGDNLQLAEFYKIKKTSLGPLRSWLDRKWHENESQVDSSRPHQAIVNLKFPTIYTTNYDRWLEIAFDRRNVKRVKIANVGDFTLDRRGAVEIVKLHGDFDDDESLVLTEESYFERLSFESPLDLKLRADIIGKSVLFIGYGMADVNVRYLWYKLHKLWEASEFSSNRPRSYVFLGRPNAVSEAILTARGLTPISAESDDPGEALSSFLEELALKAFGVKSAVAPASSS
jgi:hypothetical protein